MPAGIYLTLKDLKLLHGFRTDAGASLYLMRLRDSLGKQKDQGVTVLEYCRYEGVAEDEVRQALR
jgi:hypothetical protein